MEVLSDIQTGELLVHNTSMGYNIPIDGSHINEVHICAPGEKAYVLQINELPGGKTGDYYAHIDAYSACFSLDAVSVQKLHVAHIHLQCTMSDRVKANHCG